jgi:hypothetical protein
MPKAVRGDILVEAGHFHGLLDKLENGHTGEMVAPEIEEDILLLAWLGHQLAADGEQIVLQEAEGAGVDRHPAFLVAFAKDLQHLLFGIDIGEFEIAEFGDP